MHVLTSSTTRRSLRVTHPGDVVRDNVDGMRGDLACWDSMPFRSLLTVRAPLAIAALLCVACGHAEGDMTTPTGTKAEPTGADEPVDLPPSPIPTDPSPELPIVDDGVLVRAASPMQFDQNRLLENWHLTGHAWVTAAQVQGFLAAKGSFLATYVDPAWNKRAADLILERSRANGLSALYMLARIQTESGLIESKTSTLLNSATGCACPDGTGCSKSYAGFGNQVECSAAKVRGYLDALEETGKTPAGWQVGHTKATFDPCQITPTNAATVALYTYTPWVGAYAKQCGRKDIGGSSLVAVKLHRYRAEYTWGDGKVPSGMCLSGTLANSVPTGTCLQASADAQWRICSAGTWRLSGTKPPAGCTERYPFCESGTLGKSVPARTCVQARSDSKWYQCVKDGAFAPAPAAATDGVGPLGLCASVHGL